jgi:lipoate-protein ligase A
MILEPVGGDVFTHLAWEEWLMESVRGPVLMLWQSDCAVVMGKNQNPWRECRLALMELEGVALARRISGGGTVYHDAGNLNYAVMVDRVDYREDMAFEMVLNALASVGVKAERRCKSNLFVEGGKCSGTAFAFRKDRVLHHGTLLLESDLERLERYLGSDCSGIETHAVASVPARVANLGVSQDRMRAALRGAFSETYGGAERVAVFPDEPSIAAIVAERRALDWVLGSTPRFTVQLADRAVEVDFRKGVVAPELSEMLYDVSTFF